MGHSDTSGVVITFRQPDAKDGAAVYALVAACPPLDTNSMYCNLLQTCHFSSTSVAAEANGELLGFISGYLLPEQPDTLFIWQVAVSEKARGKGLASQMLMSILQRPNCKQVQHLETTITPDNKASWGLFESLAVKLGANLTRTVMFDRHQHFANQHDTEMLAHLGPFSL